MKNEIWSNINNNIECDQIFKSMESRDDKIGNDEWNDTWRGKLATLPRTYGIDNVDCKISNHT